MSLLKFERRGEGFFMRGAECWSRGAGLLEVWWRLRGFESTEVAEARRMRLLEELRVSLLVDLDLARPAALWGSIYMACFNLLLGFMLSGRPFRVASSLLYLSTSVVSLLISRDNSSFSPF